MFRKNKKVKQWSIGIPAVAIEPTEFKCEFCGKSYQSVVCLLPVDAPALNVCAGCIAKALRKSMGQLPPDSARC